MASEGVIGKTAGLLLLLMVPAEFLAAPAMAGSAFTGYGLAGVSAGDGDTTVFTSQDFRIILFNSNRNGIGLEFGTFGLFKDDDTKAHETYAALSWATNQGRLTVGVPRPAYDAVAISPLDRLFPLSARDRIIITRSTATWEAMFAGEVPYGAAFHGEAPGLLWALSANGVVDEDQMILGGSVAWQTDGVIAEGAAEFVDIEGDTGVSVKGRLAVLRDWGEASVSLYAPQDQDADAMLELSARLDVTERLDIFAVASAQANEGPAFAGVAGEYAIARHVFAQAGLSSDDGQGAISAAIGFQF